MIECLLRGRSKQQAKCPLKRGVWEFEVYCLYVAGAVTKCLLTGSVLQHEVCTSEGSNVFTLSLIFFFCLSPCLVF